MCAIFGTIILKPSVKDLALIRKVFLESMVRGKHATGISFLPHWSDKVITIKEPFSADKFIESHLRDSDLPNLISGDGNLYMIGHCRYSTSDLTYNQPISNGDISIAHNGVVTQESPETWESLYGYSYETKNDSEIVLRTVESNDCPLTKYPDSSLSVVELYNDKKIRFYRNGKRPMYLTTKRNGYIISSTKNIVERAIGNDFDGTISKTSPYVYGTISSDLKLIELKMEPPIGFKDLQ